MDNYILIGMPGSGKTTKGRKLAKTLKKKFLDTDQYIQNKTGSSPADIVKNKGREGFLKIQDKLISSIDLTDTVVSTGGGIIYSEKAVGNLAGQGTVIYLNVPFHKISERFSTERKLSSTEGKSLKDIYNERHPLYKRFADIEIICDDKEADEIIKDMITEIKRREKK